MTSPSGLSGLLFALAAASLYGVNIVSTRFAALAGISGVTLVFYRVFVMLALVAAAAALWRTPLRIAAGERGTVAVLGIATAALGAAYLSSVAFIPVTVAVVIFYTYPVLIVLASPLVDGSRITGTLIAVVALAAMGVVLVVGPAFHGLDWRGLALAAPASLATAVQVFAATRCRRTGVVAKVFWLRADAAGRPRPCARRRRGDDRLLCAGLRVPVRGARALLGGRRRHRVLRRAGGRGAGLRRRCSANGSPRCSSWAVLLCSPRS